MINPHNPEFITKRPWYLGGDAADGPSLDHQANQKDESERLELSLAAAEKLVEEERKKLKKAKKGNKFCVGMWVEAMKKNRRPYMICQIVRIAKKGTVFDLKFEDGSMETNVKMKKSERGKVSARIRLTKTGSRSFNIDHAAHGKETYDSKRDKYHGYEVQEHLDTLKEKYAERDAIRKKLRAKKQAEMDEQKSSEGGDGGEKKDRADKSDYDSDSDSDVGSDSDDEFVQKDADAKVHVSRHARQGGVGGNQMKVTARNLRIREDTAKYLRNLDPNSAYYDPKSRSMRDNPNPETDPTESTFAGDNFARISGDAIGLAQTQVFAWDVEKATGGASSVIHPQANPSLAETLKKEYTNKEVDLKTKRKKAVLDKYGGAEYLDGDEGLGSTKALTGSGSNAGQSETERERAAEKRKARFGVTVKEEHYSRDGRAKSGAGLAKTYTNQKSKYEEDVFMNGHTTVWGSYFHKGAFRWGFADDHSLMKSSYCTGATGRAANDEANEMRYGNGVAGSAALAQAREILKAMPKTDKASSLSKARPTSSQHYGEADQFAELDQDKVKEALKKNEQTKKTGGSKRKYNSVDAEVDVTAEEMEAYRLKKERADDPLAKLAESEEILEYK
eukprot:CAMPEP_0203663270 /NCGR_PEP_ID=MMETSP0090-20130426/914_1 /ASSEMBLY_ACC=CAM_ASM_001088 /TAXON_ID=426623 /ORGANISM="Chaetoceros affinis, Strain CCMP159" /LENGTH=617 /DNA_ID=CAMNT_0050526155 /DNA_START=241 /DNA_END=2094 /DNA_ORIENTATION=+